MRQEISPEKMFVKIILIDRHACWSNVVVGKVIYLKKNIGEGDRVEI